MSPKNEMFSIGLHEIQKEIFFGEAARFKIIAKGRRFGLTRGLAMFVVMKMLTPAGINVLWVDTIYSNIERYFDRYFRPELKKLDRRIWSYNKNKSELKIITDYGASVLDMRSADRPENLEGFGYHLIIINEAGIVLKNRNLWQESILPMTLDYKADVVIGGTPKGKRTKKNEKHLFYELYEKGMTDNTGRYKSYNYSSYDNPLLDKGEIDELVKETPAYLRSQEIFGLFIDKGGSGIIKGSWWKFINENEVFKERVIKKIQIWDTAFKEKQENDFSVCETWLITPNKYILLNVFRDRIEFPDLKKAAVDQYNLYSPNEVWIEDKASGISLIQELKRGTRMPIKGISADKEKLEYINAVTPLIEQGKVYLVEGKEWLKEFMDECEDYPNVEFDDQIDIMAKFLNEAKEKITEGIPQLKTLRRKNIPRYKGFR
ncbi:MAG: phage terminase large subunit [Ignavibacterium sp.]|nr:phage terminase large subunit [Ignavibacterium sp.]